MMKGLGFDESMSNLTSTISGETIISSNATNDQSSPFASPHQLQPPAKKKRGVPGNPDPEAEVIALSPKSLLTKNRFICEICNKGFQRDQNLQLHRRGHNLPWKLKQRAKDDIIRKKVYICPEISCVHHDPSRALGDLTGIKKHFCRKHGEKKWKCEKCDKKYAVQSDWKAHSKICGTREYRCDCGTLFSRKDSFITHRAFCDALALESGRLINPLTNLFPSSYSHQTTTSNNNNNNNNNNNALLSHLTSHHLLLQPFALKQEQSDFPPWLACPPQPQPQPTIADGGVHNHLENRHSSHLLHTFHHYNNHKYKQRSSSNNKSNSNSTSNVIVGPTLSSFQAPMNPQMSATALLQKATEMGVTLNNHNQHHHDHDQLVLTNSCG